VKLRWNPIQSFLIACVRGYQTVVSPLLPRRCKYYPSCSQYAVDAVREYGAARGVVLAVWRLLRCNPLSYGGYDPVEKQKVFAVRGADGSACGTTGRA
jgi:putative membrane protein insertion efficiency factor